MRNGFEHNFEQLDEPEEVEIEKLIFRPTQNKSKYAFQLFDSKITV